MAKTPVIAIVDDDEGVRASLASLVRSLGYEAHAYESGVAFLREPAGEDPACMIADVQMPVIPGDELQARLVASGRHFPPRTLNNVLVMRPTSVLRPDAINLVRFAGGLRQLL